MTREFFSIAGVVAWIVMSSRYPKNFLWLGKRGEIVFAFLPCAALLFTVAVWPELRPDVRQVVGFAVLAFLLIGAVCSFFWEPVVNFRALLLGKPGVPAATSNDTSQTGEGD